MRLRDFYRSVEKHARKIARGGLEKLTAGAFTLSSIAGGAYASKVNANPITVEAYLPITNLIADGTTIYQMNARVNSSVELNATNWSVYIPMNRFTLEQPPMQPQIPTVNDYFEGWNMDPGGTYIEETINPNTSVLEHSFRNTAGAFGPAGIGDLETIYFTVNQNAPIGPVTCQNCAENIAAFAFNFLDTSEMSYTDGAGGGITRIDGTYTIVEVGDMNFDGAVDINDLPSFTDALMNPDTYNSQRQTGTVGSADMNGNGIVDGNDIQGFVNALMGN